jgi:hypothetical protein
MPPPELLYSLCLAAGLALGRVLFGRRRPVHGAASFDMDPRLMEGKHLVRGLPPVAPAAARSFAPFRIIFSCI